MGLYSNSMEIAVVVMQPLVSRVLVDEQAAERLQRRFKAEQHMSAAKAGAAPQPPRAPEKPRSAKLMAHGTAIASSNPPPPPPPPPELEAVDPPPSAKSDRSGRDPQSGVADVTQLLSLSEESVMQNTMARQGVKGQWHGLHPRAPPQAGTLRRRRRRNA